MGLLFCLIGLLSGYICGRRSLVAGLGAVLTTGYFFGITRARYLETFTYFLFDAAVFGFYISQLERQLKPGERLRIQDLKKWVMLLIGWPFLLLFVPFQDPLVQAVGFRGNAYLLPFLLIGALLRYEQAYRLALWIAVLNVVVFGFAGTQFFVGIEPFYPQNAITELIYRSRDVAEFTAYRIPATFSNSASYGATMVISLPWLIGAWAQSSQQGWRGSLLTAGIVAALLGVFLAASRSQAAVLFVLLTLVTLPGRLRTSLWLRWILILAAVGYIVFSDARLRRFESLQDTEMVANRVGASVNVGFLDLLTGHPLGNGLGGGGTSIPAFLHDRIRAPMAVENEYGRILLEQGIPGLFLWIAFIFWILTRSTTHPRETWYLGRRLLWLLCVINFSFAAIGIGLLTAIPFSSLLLLSVGWIAVRQPSAAVSPAAPGHEPSLQQQQRIAAARPA